ncbi:hypothetical protein THAOC_04108, partial [Thalassiosira oceanica]
MSEDRDQEGFGPSAATIPTSNVTTPAARAQPATTPAANAQPATTFLAWGKSVASDDNAAIKAGFSIPNTKLRKEDQANNKT